MNIGDWVRIADTVPLGWHHAAVCCGKVGRIIVSFGDNPGTFIVKNPETPFTVWVPASVLTLVPCPYYLPEPEGEPTVTTSTNFSTAIFLYNDAVRALRTVYESDASYKAAHHGQPAPRELAKTMDPDIKVGDLVIVPTTTRHGFTVVQVVETDVDFDIETSEQVRWVAAKFDPADLQKTMAWENKNNETIRSAQRTAKRKELAEKIKADNPALTTSLGAIAHQPADDAPQS